MAIPTEEQNEIRLNIDTDVIIDSQSSSCSKISGDFKELIRDLKKFLILDFKKVSKKTSKNSTEDFLNTIKDYITSRMNISNPSEDLIHSLGMIVNPKDTVR